ncbi:hypothetical protein NDU88_001935 [Pleurodeles waltl]|uniref:Uncharacterized protein n=1 Tax=Pleurodeles waltl TaxID=8319 RepID=A0AAV7LEA6_PLEWA|nr:hypothetical protein NDU88_001935 [Pleurodeles waltl]
MQFISSKFSEWCAKCKIICKRLVDTWLVSSALHFAAMCACKTYGRGKTEYDDLVGGQNRTPYTLELYENLWTNASSIDKEKKEK